MKHYSNKIYIILLAPLVFSFAVGQDIFVPEVPALIDIFSTQQNLVQLTLSLFIFAVGIGQLLFGPLADRFGRKKITLISILLYCGSSVFAACATSIFMLIYARILQGFGACGMMVCAFAIARDVTTGNETGKLFSYLNSAIAISPLLAPIIGGYLFHWFNWQAPFIALAVFSGFAFVAFSLVYQETLLPQYMIKFDLNVFKRYLSIIRHKQFAIFCFTASSTLACFFTFFSVSSYILIGQLNQSSITFGYYFGLIGLVFLIASMTAAKVCEKYGIKVTVTLGSIGLFGAGVMMLLWTIFGGTTLLSFMIPTIIASFMGSFAIGASAAGALQPFKKMAGTAAAVLGACEFLFATLIATIVMHWPVTSNISYAIPLILLGSLMSLLMFKNTVSFASSQ